MCGLRLCCVSASTGMMRVCVSSQPFHANFFLISMFSQEIKGHVLLFQHEVYLMFFRGFSKTE